MPPTPCQALPPLPLQESHLREVAALGAQLAAAEAEREAAAQRAQQLEHIRHKNLERIVNLKQARLFVAVRSPYGPMPECFNDVGRLGL